MKKIVILSVLLYVLIGCSNEEVKKEEVAISDMFTRRDMDESYYHDDYEEIEVKSDIEISEEGTYVLTGDANDVVVSVNTEDKVQLVLDGLKITNSVDSPIYIENAEKVFIMLAEDSENNLSITEETEADAVIKSHDDLTINGSGSLEINSSVKGISSNDDLKITNGSYVITAGSHGLDANNSVRVAKGNIKIESASDGIHSEEETDNLGFVYIENGEFEINSVGDGISAYTYLEVVDGTFNITTNSGSVEPAAGQEMGPGGAGVPGGDRGMQPNSSTTSITDTFTSAKAIKAVQTVTINGGKFIIDANDDALHSDDSLVINDGTFDIKSSDDGINASTGGNNDTQDRGSDSSASTVITGGNIKVDSGGDGGGSNGTIDISGGSTIIESVESSGNYSLDYDVSANITGGEFVAFGVSGMETNFTSAEQGTMLLSTNSMQTGQVQVKNSSGELVSYTTDKSYNSIIISSPSISSGNTYDVVLGSQTSSITMSNNIYGESRGMGGPR